MKTIPTLLSILVGILSIVFFGEHILETASVLYNNYNSSYSVDSKNVAQSPVTDGQIPTTLNMSVPRAIRKAFLAVEQAEGAGATVRRSVGTPQLRNFSPFLMLDQFNVKPGAGFPDHPHRGQEVSPAQSSPTLHFLPALHV